MQSEEIMTDNSISGSASTEKKLEILIVPHEKWAEIETRSRHFKLYQAALEGDWRTAERIFKKHENDITAKLSKQGDTALHIAAAAGHPNFVKKLLERMKKEDLAIQNNAGNTAFFLAAATRRVEIVKSMMEKNEDLVKNKGDNDMLPLHKAAMMGDKKMVEFLYEATGQELLDDFNRFELLVGLINRGLYDIALDLVEMHPEMALARDKNEETALHHLAKMPVLIPARSFMGIVVGMKFLIRLCKDVIKEVNKRRQSVQHINKLGLRYRIKEREQRFGRRYRCAEARSQVHSLGEKTPLSALKLIKRLWEQVLLLDDSQMSDIIRKPWPIIFEAAKRGNYAFLKVILKTYPDLMFEVDENHYSIFHFAVMYRQNSIFEIIYNIGPLRDLIVQRKDEEGNNILHLAAKLPPPDSPINESSGPAFQMSRELLWFKAVKRILRPVDAEAPNKDGKTARALFTEQHKELKDKAEKWTKEIANACIVAATIIATMVFAAALTVPGGTNQDTGTPQFVQRAPFIIFAISDTAALLLSSLSIVRFISVLSSPYKETNYDPWLFYSLRDGVLHLLQSLLLTLVVHCATMFIVFKDGMLWIPIFVTAATAITSLEILATYGAALEDCLGIKPSELVSAGERLSNHLV